MNECGLTGRKKGNIPLFVNAVLDDGRAVRLTPCASMTRMPQPDMECPMAKAGNTTCNVSFSAFPGDWI